MTAAEHDRFADDAGAYLLGALEDHERSAFERHVAVCHVCRDEVDRLRVAADALQRSVEQYAAPPSLKTALMREVRADARAAPRRDWAARLRGAVLRPRLALAATLLALVAGLAGGMALSGLDSEDGGARSIAAAVDDTRLGAGEATLVLPEGEGPGVLRVEAMPQLRRGQVYEIWLQRGEKIEPGPLFAVDRNGRGAAAIPADLDGVDAVMVTRERRGGARRPTEAPVITAEL